MTKTISRSQRATWNYLSSLLGFVGANLFAFIATPIILQSIGAEAFGVFRVASDWTGYLTLLEFGIGGALIPVLAKTCAKETRQQVALTVAIAMRSYIFLSGLMIALGLALIFFIPNLVRVSPSLANNLQLGVGFSVLGLCLFPLSAFQVLAQVSQRGYIVNTLNLVQNISINALSLLFAWLGMSIAGQFAANFIGSLILSIGLTGFFVRLYPNIFNSIFTKSTELRLQIERELWQLNWPVFVISVCGRISLMTDNIIIAGVLGPGLVASFFLTQRLPTLAANQIQGISAASWPGLVDLYHNGETDVFSRRLVELTKLTVVAGIAVLLPVTVYNTNFVSLWVGNAQYAGELVTFFASFNNLLLSVFSLWTTLLIGIGNVALLVPIVVCSAIVNCLLSWLCTVHLGVSGPLIGTGIAFVMTYLWWLPWLFQREFKIPMWQLLGAVVKPLTIGIPLGCFLWFFTRDTLEFGWLGLALKICLAIAMYLLLAVGLLLNKSERSSLLARFAKFIPMKTTR
jgi:O-antigen/teichoic acid export membrane protein